ncbi:MAG: hypothetical protein LBU34_11080 [Planctomycetaceae bacterium]|nr:hypothetical protein [Planctomycetaceae bacterium]
MHISRLWVKTFTNGIIAVAVENPQATTLTIHYQLFTNLFPVLQYFTIRCKIFSQH